MLLCNAQRTNDQGFTLAETLIVVIVIGVLAAIVGPSFVGMFNKNKVSDSVDRIRGALKEAQREAINKSKTCVVDVPAGNNITISSPSTTEDSNANGTLDPGEDTNGNGRLDSTTPCLLSGNRSLDGISLSYEGTPSSSRIKFDFKGRIDDVASAKTIIVSAPNTEAKKCLVISYGLGIFRNGDYDATRATDKCVTTRPKL